MFCKVIPEQQRLSKNFDYTTWIIRSQALGKSGPGFKELLSKFYVNLSLSHGTQKSKIWLCILSLMFFFDK